jgi:hypothetical protein
MRRIAAVLLGLLAAPSALAGGEACILTGTHTILGGKKPPIITLRLDCGTSPSDAERRHVDMVGNSQNIADGVRYMVGEGFDIASGSTMNSYTGNSIVSTYTFVKPRIVASGAPELPPMPAMEDESLDGPIDGGDPAGAEF